MAEETNAAPVYKNGETLDKIWANNEATASVPPATPPTPVTTDVTQNVPTPQGGDNSQQANAGAPPVSTPDVPPVENNVEDNSATMVLPDFDSPQATSPAATPAPAAAAPAPATFNWKDEVKKVDRAEVLKELGLSEFALEIDEHLKRGGNAADYLAAKAVNYDTVSDEDLVKDSFRKQFPTFTKEEVNRLYAKKYGVNDDMSDEEKADRQLELKADAHVRREAAKAEQSKFKLPEPVTQAAPTTTPTNDDHQQQIQQARQWFQEHEATKNLMTSKRVALDLGNGVMFNVNIDKPEVLTRVMTDPEVWNKVTSTPQGEPDVAGLQEIALFALNREQFKKDIFNYGKAMAIRDLKVDGQNIRIPPKPMPQQQTIPEKEAWKGAKSSTVGGR